MADISGGEDGRRRSLGPLRRLYPYIFRYRKLVIGAVISLVVAAATTLALPTGPWPASMRPFLKLEAAAIEKPRLLKWSASLYISRN